MQTDARLVLEPLVLDSVPLKGRVLIEASAGTGKTWTIAALYVRLLLEARLPVERILVLTFTNAATAELRTRIQARLIEVRDALIGDGATPTDELIVSMLHRSDDRRGDVLWLNAAIERFDLAPIHTIHGFCQRVLSEHAFASGMPFETELLGDDAPLIEAAVRDCWRNDLAAAHPLWAQWLHAHDMHPALWSRRIAALLARPEAQLHLPPQPPPNLEAAYLEALGQVRALWRTQADEAFALVETSTALNRTNYSKQHMPGWRRKIGECLASLSMEKSLHDCIERFTPAGLLARVKKGEPPAHPLFVALERWSGLHAAFSARFAHWTVESARRIDAQLQLQKRERRVQTYDDLLRNLEEALLGPGGSALAATLRESYAAALIDEFQDTDPRQYGIFEAIYGDTDQPRYFVGDPKQAIYAFRGADVHAYLRARDKAEAGFTLSHNRRSVPSLVQALNNLFGANADAFLASDIRYRPIEARAKDSVLQIEGEAQPAAMQCWFMAREEQSKAIGKGVAAENVVAGTASEIARLLALGSRGAAQLREDGTTRNLAGCDIAVLVRTHAQAQRLRDALAQRGVASVTYGQDNVYASPEAAELAYVLAAVAEPTREDLLRGALATEILGRDAQVLDALANDEHAWESLLDRFSGYQKLARDQGFIRMWQSLIMDESVSARLLGLPYGERRLTNLRHLADLLHAAESAEGLDLEGLMRHLERQRAQPGGKVEAQQLRLESDENLVRVLTVHAAKGLEFSVVFCPFLWDVPQRREQNDLLSFHTDDHAFAFDFGSPQREAHRARAKAEAFGECLRVAYVALTRAKHRCIWAWGKIAGAEESALAWLLHGEGLKGPEELAAHFKSLDDADLRATLSVIESAAPGALRVCNGSTEAAEFTQSGSAAPLKLQARAFDIALPRPWRVSSFSALIAAQEREAPDYDALTIVGRSTVPAETPPDNALFALPGGVHTGTLIHRLFEGIDFRAAQAAAIGRFVRDTLADFDFDARWAPALERMLSDVVATPLDERGDIRLERIAESQRLIELEFIFPVGETSLAALRAALSPLRVLGSHLPDVIGSTVLAPSRGFIKGYIDLVFELDGRHYIADYKSNRLGSRYEDYEPERLAVAMSDSFYDLQYVLYSAALNRYLALRIPDYDYERHFGGVYYLFVRGMAPERGATSGVYFTRPPRSLIEAVDQALQARERWFA